MAPSSPTLTVVPNRRHSGSDWSEDDSPQVPHGVTVTPLDQPKVVIPSTVFPKTSKDEAPSFLKPYLNLGLSSIRVCSAAHTSVMTFLRKNAGFRRLHYHPAEHNT